MRASIESLVQLSGIVEGRRRRPRAAHSKQTQNGGGKVHVVVRTRNGRSVGLLVDRILDTVEDDLSTRRPSARKGILGSVTSSVLRNPEQPPSKALDLPRAARDVI